jgi:hypothetical protein
MRLNAQEGLAKSHEAGNVEKGIRCKLVELYTVHKQKPTEKSMGRKRETSKEESKKHYPVAARGLRDPVGAGEDDGIFGGDEAVHFGLLHLLLGDGGANPAGGGGLGHGVLNGQMLHTHPIRRALGGSEREEEISNGGGGGNELVNSAIPHYAIFFLNRGRVPKDPDASFIHSGGVTFYIRAYLKK